MEDPLTVKRKDALTERAKRRGLEILFIDLHAAVDHINIGKQLRLRAHRADGGDRRDLLALLEVMEQRTGEQEAPLP